MNALGRAKRGARFLDRRLGRGWRRKIRRRDLRMSSGVYHTKGDCGCILAQLFGRYGLGLTQLGITRQADRLGFDVDQSDSYEELDEAWLTVLRENL